MTNDDWNADDFDSVFDIENLPKSPHIPGMCVLYFSADETGAIIHILDAKTDDINKWTFEKVHWTRVEAPIQFVGASEWTTNREDMEIMRCTGAHLSMGPRANPAARAFALDYVREKTECAIAADGLDSQKIPRDHRDESNTPMQRDEYLTLEAATGTVHLASYRYPNIRFLDDDPEELGGVEQLDSLCGHLHIQHAESIGRLLPTEDPADRDDLCGRCRSLYNQPDRRVAAQS